MKVIIGLVLLAVIGPATIAVRMLVPSQPAGGYGVGIQPPPIPRFYDGPPRKDPFNEPRAVLYPHGVWEGEPGQPDSVWHPPGSWRYLGEGIE